MRTLIISGGDYAPLPNVPHDSIIACDRGYLYARRMGVQPDLIIGDFDSAPIPEGEIQIERFPSHKDDTDTMLAVKKALSMGSRDILIACAFGGRLDHTMANIQSGAYIAGQGGTARLFGAGTQAVIFGKGTESFPQRDHGSLSVFSLSETAIISIKGAEYSGEGIRLSAAFPLGVSNAWAEDTIWVTVQEGTVMVMICDLAQESGRNVQIGTAYGESISGMR